MGLCTLLACIASRADPDPASIWSLSGFGTVGVARSGTRGAEFIRDILQKRGVAGAASADADSRLGLQLKVQPAADVEGVVQAVSAYGYDGTYRPELTWAFAGYAPTPDVKLRAGRLGWDVYMLSDSRNVGYSYLWVRPPVEYFGQLQIAHIDGGDLVLRRQLGAGVGSLKIYGGRVRQKLPVPPAGEFDLTGSRVLGANVDYQHDGWHMRAGYTRTRLANDLPAFAPLLTALRATNLPSATALAQDLSLAGKSALIVSGGVVYERGPWQSQLLLNRLTSNSPMFPRKDSGNFLVAYRVGELTPFANYSAVRTKGNARASGLPTPNPLDDGVALALSVTQSRQWTLSFGVRWDVARNADLKLQLDRVRVDDHAAFLWRNAQPDWNGHANVLSVALDFVF